MKDETLFQYQQLGGVDRERVYDVVGLEYYNPILHPTCANFRAASLNLITRLLEGRSTVRRTLDLGAGRSVVPEIRVEGLSDFGEVTLFDGSPEMLSNNPAGFLSEVEVLVGNPGSIPVEKESFDLILSSLGDPYNCINVWSECCRILASKGCLIYTTPAYEWMLRYRVTEEGTADNVSRFVDRNGRAHDLPSYVYPPEVQVQMFESSGLRVTGIEVCFAADIPGPLSPKLLSCASERLPIVRGYALRKAQ